MSKAALPGLLAMTFVAGACTSSPDQAVALPPAPPVVTVDMDEFSFTYDPDIPAGRVVFRGHNVGEVVHNLVLLPLDEDLPPLDEQLRGEERRVATPFAALRPVPPGQAREFAVDLAPGQRYGIFCSVADGEGKSHALKGMNSEFRTLPAPAGRDQDDEPEDSDE